MTTTINVALGDGHIRSGSSIYSTALGGGTLVVDGNASYVRVGQDKVGSTYYVYEGFFRFGTINPSDEQIVTAYFDLYCVTAAGAGVARELGIRGYDWNEPLGTDNYRTVSQITALTRYGYAGGISAAGGLHVYAQEGTLNDWLFNGSANDRQVIVYNSRITGSDVPAAAEYNDFQAVGGGSDDPAIVWTSVPKHPLLRVGSCQVQLSNGDHVYIEAPNGNVTPGVVNLKRYDGTTHTTIASNLLSGTRDMGYSNHSFQQWALIRDDSDNIYWLGHAGGGGNTLNVVTWQKTGTNTWTEKPYRQADMPSNPGIINNIAAAWHSAGSSGTIMVVLGRDNMPTNASPDDEISYALVNCQYLLTGSGSMLRASGDAFAAGLITPWSNPDDFNMPINCTGTGLDVVALPNSSTRGVVICHDRNSKMGDYAPIGIVRYILNSTGTAISQANAATQDLYSTKDAGSKARVLPISDTRFVVVTLDMDPGWGPTIYVLQNSGTNTSFNTLGATLLDDEGIASLPSTSSLHNKPIWDALYHPDANQVYFYYFDTADSRKLMRTSFDLSTYQAVRNEIVVASGTNVAPAGSTTVGMRVQRGKVTESEAMVTIVAKTGTTQHAPQYVKDPLNVAPAAPTLVDKANYDATTGSLFDWTFNDANVGDTQTAYEFQIDNADTLASVVATGKVTSSTSERNVTGGTLTNGVNYRWRVRTWDTSDVVGAWSGYDFFTTSAGGSVNITNPATDNPAGWIYDDVTVTWSASGITQASYRVWLKNNITGATISDTNWITSTATSHQLTGLSSDVEYRIEVQVRNAALVTSNIATRLLTPNFNEPEIPTVAVSALDDQGHVLIDIVNPVPQGDKPEVTYNKIQRRRAGTSAWTTVAQVGYNGSYQDWHTGSGITYEYQVIAVATIGTATSDLYSATPNLMGVWLHVPSDPAGTARNYMFGANQRGATHTSYSELTHYAGREDPVADFAHYHDQTFNVVVDIPYGEDYHDQIDGLHELEGDHGVLVYRDNRRRNAFGVLNGGFSETDQPWGLQVSFDFTKVHYNEEVV